MRAILGLLLAALLGGCTTLDKSGEHSPYFTVRPGSTLVLHRTVTVPAYRADIFIQAGHLVVPPEVNPYYPNCNLTLHDIRAEPQRISPGRFAVTAFRREIDQPFGFLSPDPYQSVFELHSADQPNVLVLTCEHWEYDPEAEHLTLAQIRAALGHVASLELAR